MLSSYARNYPCSNLLIPPRIVRRDAPILASVLLCALSSRARLSILSLPVLTIPVATTIHLSSVLIRCIHLRHISCWACFAFITIVLNTTATKERPYNTVVAFVTLDRSTDKRQE